MYLRSCANLANQQFRLGSGILRALCRSASSNCCQDTKYHCIGYQ